jgi:iron complex outermembrane recepter protein
MKTLWLFVYSVCFLSAINAQTGFKLSGRITDEKGEPLPGAYLSFVDEKIGTIADDRGNYILNAIPGGHHIIEISHTGYGTIVEHIELKSALEKNFSLTPVVIENQGVIVTGVSGATNIRKAPVAVNLIRKQTLLQSASANLVDALTRIPGVSQVSSGPGISKPFIRGLGYNRVVTINEGVRQEGQQWGDEHGIEIDELSIARAEVWKGPASLMYGSDALAGVVNFITNIPVQEGTLKANFLSNYQSNAGLIAVNASIAANKNGFNWNVYGTRKSSHDYKNNADGPVLNSRFNENNFGGYAGLNKSWGYTHFIISRFDQKVGLIEGKRDDVTGKFLLYAGSPIEHIASDDEIESRKMLVPYQHIRHLKFVTDNSFVIRKSRLKLNLGYQQNLRDEFGNPEQSAEKELGFDLKTINYNLQWQLPEVKEWHTTAGLNGMRQSNKNTGEEMIIPEYSLFDAGVFIYAQRFFQKATFSTGIRFDNRSIDAEGMQDPFNRSFSNLSMSAGISIEPSPVFVARLNLARGFRSPTLPELASNGVHEGTNRYEYGDINLNSETSLQLDAGFDLNYEHFNISLVGFYNHIADFIFYRKLQSIFGGDSLVIINGEAIPAFKFNQQNARLTGLEAVIDVHPHPLDWLHFENSFSFVRGLFSESIDGSENLPLIPAPRWTSELRGSFNKAGKLLRNFYIKLEADVNLDQDKPFTGFNTETATSGFTLFNAGAGSDFFSKEKTICSMHLSLTNLTDVIYQQHQSRLKYTSKNMVTGREGVFNMGRNFSIKVLIPFTAIIK